MTKYIVPPRTYISVFVALLVLLALTLAAAAIDMGRLNLTVALTIAAAKAVLIALYFMQVRYHSPLIALAAGGGILWFLILIGMTFDDFLTR